MTHGSDIDPNEGAPAATASDSSTGVLGSRDAADAGANAFATLSDEQLALLAQERNGEESEAAYGELVTRLERPLYGFLVVRVGNSAEAEEIVQDAFLRAWTKLEKYDARWRFTTWLFTVAKRVAVSRARQRRPDALSEEMASGVTGGDDHTGDVEVRDDAANVWAVAARILTPEQRSALWLRYAEDRSNEEIAEILGRKRVTVRVLLFRAREALAAAIGEDRGRTKTARARAANEPEGPKETNTTARRLNSIASVPGAAR